MQREFCTLFDSNYLYKAVVMHRSLMRHCESFRTTAFCFDDDAARVLGRMKLPSLDIVTLGQLEEFDPELRSVKPDRSRVEYLWTSTPALPLYVLGTRPEVSEITYVDADLMFFGDPEPLFEEMGDASVALTPHRYSPEYRQHAHNGVYNVQFLPFRRDERGLEILQWWHDRCIEWCYYRLEDGKIGDQAYLNDWPERFDGVHVLQHKGAGLAPWNVSNYKIRRRGHELFVDDDPLVFFHYHDVTLDREGHHDPRPARYYLTLPVRRRLYSPYFQQIDYAIGEVQTVDLGFDAGLGERPTLGARFRKARFRISLWWKSLTARRGSSD
jgi:hypothetical protein